MTTAVYPGSFDPITNGHLDIIKRASLICDKLIVGILENSSKNHAFSTEERAEMVRNVTKDIKNVEVEIFNGLLVDFVNLKNAQFIVKGLRTASDFDYERQMALVNKTVDNSCETVCMMADVKYSYISSSVVKEIAKYNGNIEGFVPNQIVNKVNERLNIK